MSKRPSINKACELLDRAARQVMTIEGYIPTKRLEVLVAEYPDHYAVKAYKEALAKVRLAEAA